MYTIECRAWNYTIKKECKGQLVSKNGKFGPFFGCTNYRCDGCKHTWRYERGEWYQRTGEDPNTNPDYWPDCSDIEDIQYEFGTFI